VAPIYGTQSLFFLSKALLARTKLPPPQFYTAANELPPAAAKKVSLDTAAIAQQALQEAAHGQFNEL
jgi:hypothetical protein